MSKIAVISDIHSNKHTLDLVLKDIEKRQVDKIYCLGDLVTKYFYPAEVVDSIKANCDIVIKGNCDDLVATNEKYKFARSKLGLDRIEYLDNLPTKEQLMINKVLINLYHSNPQDLETMFNPLFTDHDKTRYKDQHIKAEDYAKMFEDERKQTSIVGHTHMNYMGIEKDNKLVIDNNLKTITPNDRAIINTGSVAEHIRLVEKKDGTIDHLIVPYVTYLIIDDANLSEGINVQMIYVDSSDTLVNVFIDSAYRQATGEFPLSPIYTTRMRDSIQAFDKNDRVKSLVEETYQEFENYRKGR